MKLNLLDFRRAVAGRTWSISLCLLSAWVAQANEAPSTELPLQSSVSQYGITWTFDQPVRVGHFVNGDFYVVGPVKIVGISPPPLAGEEVPNDQVDAAEKKNKKSMKN